MADGERQGAPGQAAESPEVAALLAKLASVTSAIHATWADGGMAAGDTLIRWRDRLAQCSEAAAVLGWRADADHAALAGAQRRHSLLELDRDERAKAYHAAEGAFTEQRDELDRERRRTAAMREVIRAAMDAGNGWVVGHSSVHYALSEMRRILYLATKEVLADDAPGRPGGEGEGR